MRSPARRSIVSSRRSANDWRGSKRNSVVPERQGLPMTSADETNTTQSQPGPRVRPRSRVGRVFSGSSDVIRIVYRDPEHVAERLTLYSADRLADASREWAASARAARPDTEPAHLAEEMRIKSGQVARIDGAIAGTPFLVAL